MCCAAHMNNIRTRFGTSLEDNNIRTASSFWPMTNVIRSSRLFPFAHNIGALCMHVCMHAQVHFNPFRPSILILFSSSYRLAVPSGNIDVWLGSGSMVARPRSGQIRGHCVASRELFARIAALASDEMFARTPAGSIAIDANTTAGIRQCFWSQCRRGGHR